MLVTTHVPRFLAYKAMLPSSPAPDLLASPLPTQLCCLQAGILRPPQIVAFMPAIRAALGSIPLQLLPPPSSRPRCSAPPLLIPSIQRCSRNSPHLGEAHWCSAHWKAQALLTGWAFLPLSENKSWVPHGACAHSPLSSEAPGGHSLLPFHGEEINAEEK